MPALTVHNAEIKTAAVEIQTLTISGKQVTLAVFRQLQIAKWYRLDVPQGLGWGTVNYHPEARRCDDLSDHLHVVWQLGTELRRAVAERPVSSRGAIGKVNPADSEKEIFRCPAMRELADVDDEGSTTVVTFPDQRSVFGPRLDEVVVSASFWTPRWSKDHECSERCQPKIQEVLRAWSRDVLAEVGAWRQWDSACALPQLFIAV